MSAKNASRQEPFWMQYFWVILSCSIVLLVNLIGGLIATQMFYSFWLSVSLFAFAPIWLWCYGLVLGSRFRYWPMLLGVCSSIFLITFFYLDALEPLKTRLQMSCGLAGGGMAAMSVGVWLNWFGSLFSGSSNATLPKDHSVNT